LLEQIPIEDFATNDAWFPILCAANHGTNGAGVEEFIEWSCGDMEYEDDEQLIRARWDSLGGKALNYTVNTLYKMVLAYGGETSVVSAQSDFDNVEDFDEDNQDDEEQGDEDKEPEEEPIDFDDIMSEPETDISIKPGVATEIASKLTLSSSSGEIKTAVRAMLKADVVESVRVIETICRNVNMNKTQLNKIIKEAKDKMNDDLGRILAEKTWDSKFYKTKGLVYNNNDQFWAYNGKFWQPISNAYVGKKITEVLDQMRKKIEINVKESSIVSEAVAILTRISAKKEDALRLREKPNPVVNCNNGELWINDDGTGVLKPHRPKSFLTQVLNVDYTPGAECPLFDKSIRNTFENFNDCEDIVRHFEEFMGYILHPDKRPAHWWLLKGPGGDGKTTLMKIISGMLGEAVIPETIDRFRGGSQGDSHATAELIGKLLVYDDDLSRNTVLPDGTLKKLSEDGQLTANPKGVQGFKFTKICTVAMLSNGFPSTKDITRGFRRRAMVIPFNRGFHEQGAITDLAEQVIAKELGGVLNRALQGLQRLRKRSKFEEPKSCLFSKEQWLNEANPVALFISEKVEKTKDHSDRITLTDAYAIYTDWCIGNNLNRMGSKQQFRSAMEDMDIVYETAGGGRKVFRGIAIEKDPVDDFDN